MYNLPKLDYKYSDLEPYIDNLTMEIHYSKHHQAYVDNLNKALQGLENPVRVKVEDLLKNLSKIPPSVRQSIINNAGGHANHSFFWKLMSPIKIAPSTNLQKILSNSFGSLDSFKEKFTEKAMSIFGSGWAFLIINSKGEMQLKRHSFQNSPLMFGNIPIMGIDVWEHAYYLKYHNRRKEYIEAWWNVVNWNQVEENLKNATSH